MTVAAGLALSATGDEPVSRGGRQAAVYRLGRRIAGVSVDYAVLLGRQRPALVSEACLSHPRHRGNYTVRHFVKGQAIPGSNVLSVLEWRKKKLSGEAMTGMAGPLEIAAALQAASERALTGIGGMKSSEPELQETLGDVEAMAHLARYYSGKIRGAAALGLYDRSGSESEKGDAVKALEDALGAWKKYAAIYTAQYTTPHLYNRVGWVDMNALTTKAAQDVEIARRWTKGTIARDEAVSNSIDRPFRK